MCILVTGATGFVGSHLAKMLVGEGEKVKVLVRGTSKLDNLQGVECEKVIGDLRDEESLERAVEGVSLVYHCAADYRLWAPRIEDLYENNVNGTRNLLQACAAKRVPRAVVTSSVAAVGIPKDGGAGNEDTPVCLEDMIGHYKRTKFLAEREAFKAAEKGQDVVIVNPSTPIGDGDIKPTETGKIVTRFLNGGMPAYVNTGLNLVDVNDVCRGHILAAQKGKSGRRYILGGFDMTLKDILEVLADITGLKAPTAELPLWFAYIVGLADTFVSTKILRKAPNVPLEGVKMARKIMYFSWERAKNELGYQPRPVRGALERAVQWFIDHDYAPETPKVKKSL